MVGQLNDLAALWWGWTVAMFWQVGLLILVIGCIDLVIRRWAWPQLRYALWSLILIKLILPPTLSLPSGVVPGLRSAARQALYWVETGAEAPVEGIASLLVNDDMLRDVAWPGAVQAGGLGDGPLLGTEIHPETSRETAARQAPPVRIAPRAHAMMIWLTGTLTLGLWLFVRLHSLAGRHAYEAAAASLPQSFYNQLADCAKRLQLRRVPRVAVAKRLTSPAVFGMVRPVLLMPTGYLSKLSRRDTEHMLLHELAHIKRGDLLVHGLYMLLQIVYWYNPLLWLARRQMHHLRELSCDATVANLLRERTTAYRQTLLETARRLLTTSVEPGLGLLGLFEDSNRLLIRLSWLTRPTWRYRTMKRVTVVAIAALMLACVLPMARAREAASNDLESVTPPAGTQLTQQMAELKARFEELMTQQQDLRARIEALNEMQLQTLMQQMAIRSAARNTDRLESSSSELYRLYTVKEGDTLAQIADSFYGPQQTNRAENMARIAKRNHLDGQDGLRVGQELWIPMSASGIEGDESAGRSTRVPPVSRNAGVSSPAESPVGPGVEWVFRDGKWMPARVAGPEEPSRSVPQAARRVRQGPRGQAVQDRQPAAAPTPAPPALQPDLVLAEPPTQVLDGVNIGEPMPSVPAPLALPQVPESGESPTAVQESMNIGAPMRDLPVPVQVRAPRPDETATLEQLQQLDAEMRRLQERMRALDEWRRHLIEQQAQPSGQWLEATEGYPYGRRVPLDEQRGKLQAELSRRAAELPAPQEGGDPQETVSVREAVEPLPTGRTLEIVNESGSIYVRGGDEPVARITAFVRGTGDTQDKLRALVDQVSLDVRRAQEKLHLAVTKPKKADGQERINWRVDLEVIVPRNARLELSQSFGDIRLSDLDGSVKAVANMGSIRATGVSGQVVLAANSGNIDFVVAEGLSAKVQAGARFGSIESDLPLDIVKPDPFSMGSRASGILGEGEGDISLATNMGSIHIRSGAGEPTRRLRY